MKESQKTNSNNKSGSDNKQKDVHVKFSLRLKFSLAIIALVSVIIISVTLFFAWRESTLLRDQVLQAVEREIVHLSNTAQQSIGVDELAIIAAINDLKKISYIKYAYVLNANDEIIQYFDQRGERQFGDQLDDNVERKLDQRLESEEIKILKTDDKHDAQGIIYDFSKTVLSKFFKKKIGAVVIGLSDIIIRNEIRSLITTFIPISLVFLGISIFGSIILASRTINPVRELQKGASIIGKGNWDYRIEIHTSDELGRLAQEFNQMTTLLKEAKDKEIESRIMEEQIEMAKEIQEGLNPMSFYDVGGVQIKGYTKAAKGVGGDYFDYIDIDDARVGALISDVSGKGIPASLVMVMIRTVFTSYITMEDVDCSRVVRAINDSLSTDFAIDKFATLFFMIYNRDTEELTFSNAGHGPLFCYRASSQKCTVTKLDGVPIGIMEDSDYKQAKVKLNQGDIVVLYTDGVTEMRNVDKEEYGLKRVQKLLLEHNSLNAEEFVELLVNDLEDFRGEAPPHDDTTVLVFKRVN